MPGIKPGLEAYKANVLSYCVISPAPAFPILVPILVKLLLYFSTWFSFESGKTYLLLIPNLRDR